jgi:phosphatidylserine/phosphatidylglycerophosphate/cardiolipin synthase-like enzyme
VLALAGLTLGYACSSATLTGASGNPPAGDPPVEIQDAGEDAPETPVADGAPTGDARPALTFTRAVRIIVEPSDSGAAMRAAIAGAQTSVHVTMYLLTAQSFIDALVARKNAGKDVKVVLNQTFPSGTNENQAAYAQLTAAGVQVVWASTAFQFAHSKCFVVDGSAAWIMTMNATYSSPTDNREFLAVDTDPQDVAQAEAIFAADFARTTASATGKLVVSPGNARDMLLELIRGATRTIDVESETLSDYQIVDALVAQQRARRTVRIVVNGTITPTPAQQQATSELKTAGVRIVTVTTPDIHSKAIVVDGTRAFVGSQNLTTNSLTRNREIGVLFDTASEVSKVATTIANDFAAGTAL